MFAKFFQSAVGAHDTGDAVLIGDPDPGMAERQGLCHQIARMRRAVQEGEVAAHAKIGKGGVRVWHQAKSPCTNQPGRSVSWP